MRCMESSVITPRLRGYGLAARKREYGAPHTSVADVVPRNAGTGIHIQQRGIASHVSWSP